MVRTKNSFSIQINLKHSSWIINLTNTKTHNCICMEIVSNDHRPLDKSYLLLFYFQLSQLNNLLNYPLSPILDNINNTNNTNNNHNNHNSNHIYHHHNNKINTSGRKRVVTYMIGIKSYFLNLLKSISIVFCR